ncbi:hypothetical protein V6N12_024855 [Hibiscus sabdariffa]|uniref:Uncharacterized protein n=1 Tax=Hibiscus sabdariffa TaxID=183260 RepID=A0ABR2B9J6_9ROSI
MHNNIFPVHRPVMPFGQTTFMFSPSAPVQVHLATPEVVEDTAWLGPEHCQSGTWYISSTLPSHSLSFPGNLPTALGSPVLSTHVSPLAPPLSTSMTSPSTTAITSSPPPPFSTFVPSSSNAATIPSLPP